MKPLRAALFVIPVLFVLWVAVPGTAAADPASCDPASDAHITAVINGNEATFTVMNENPLCEPVNIGMAVYLKDADGFVMPQELADSDTGTITTGSVVLSVTLPTDGIDPSCFWQIDAFTGAVLPQIDETHQYGPRLLAYQWGATPNCGEVLAETSTTSKTTTTTEATTTSTPDTVEGVQVSRSEPPQVDALARTGSPIDLTPLYMSAGLLLMIGGALQAWVHRPA